MGNLDQFGVEICSFDLKFVNISSIPISFIFQIGMPYQFLIVAENRLCRIQDRNLIWAAIDYQKCSGCLCDWLQV
jgi:hypothetical protein